MPRPLRRSLPGQLYFVTIRCVEEKFLLRPEPELNEIIGFWLAKTAKRSGVRIVAFVVMSNHLHLVLQATRGFSEAMQYFESNVARAVNFLRNRHGPFWAHRFHSQPILDLPSLYDRVVYCATNPVNAGLVNESRKWPGLQSFGASAERTFRRFHRRAWTRAGRPENRAPYWEEATLTLEMPLEIASPLDASIAVEGMVAEQERNLRRTRERANRAWLGTRAVLRQDPLDRPPVPKRTPQPRCFANTGELRRMFSEQWRAFVAAYRAASVRFRKGILGTTFPEGSHPPWMASRLVASTA